MILGNYKAGRRLNVLRMVMVSVALVSLLPPSLAQDRHGATPKTILVLYWYGREWPSNVTFEQDFLASLQSAPAGSVEYYSEYLESNRFPGENQARLLRDYMRKKYAYRSIDVVVAVSDVSLNFLLKYRNDLFPNTPIVFLAIKPPTANQLAALPGITGIIHRNAYRNTLDLALRLHPATERAFVISGTLEHDKRYETECREEFQDYEDRLTITYLTDLTPDELIMEMSRLPQHSIVLYVFQQLKNQQGKLLETRDILALIANSTPAPIYGLSDWQIGRGIVGGYVRALDSNGARAAEIAVRIANGERAQDIPVENTPIMPIFDWRELKRWGISENLLPTGSIVRFRGPSFWDQYKWYSIGVISVIVAQSLLIAFLTTIRTLRKRTEAALRESEKRFRDMADTAPVMIWISGVDRLCTYFNQQWINFTGRSLAEQIGYGWAAGVHADDYERSVKTYNSAFDLREPFTMEYRLRRADGQFRWVLDSGTPRFSAGREFIGFIGSCIDITERKEAERALQDLGGQLIRAREDECARIARELHDDLNQRMALISIDLEQLGQSLPNKNGEMRNHMRGILKQAAEVSQEIHRISYDLHPSKLAQLGLVASVRSLCTGLERSHDLRIEFLHEGALLDLPPDISLCLYRIVQECLNNVVRHSGARDARVELRRTEREIQLQVSDSGCGFDMGSPGLNKGLGLVSMRERLRLVGGTISIKSRPSQGTRVYATVPLTAMVSNEEHDSTKRPQAATVTSKG